MALDIYWIGLLVLIPSVTLVAGRDVLARRLLRPSLPDKVLRHDADADADADAAADTHADADTDTEATQFRRTFLQVYLLVMGSEWLQGPYLYSLLHNEKQMAEHLVAMLYVTAYSSAAVSAPLTGWLADRFGRRAACLVFCLVHSLASVSVLSQQVPVLILGRVLAGIAITLLWTSFESWMVTEHNARRLGDSTIPLSSMFGIMTTVNCATAIVAGVLAHCLVLTFGSKADPFMLGLILNLTASVLMLRTWNENTGRPSTADQESNGRQEPASSPCCPLSGSLEDGRVWTLGFVSCCFEGTIFLLMFYWPGTLQEAHDKASAEAKDGGTSIPYGVIFASFMATMVLGVLLFQHTMRHRRQGPAEGRDGWLTILTPTRLVAAALMLAAACFLAAAFATSELHLFGLFLLIEACNGVYVPSMAFQRGRLVADSGRASVYGLMNIPLFVFVVLALLSTSAGQDKHRKLVFLFCACLLSGASVAAMVGLRQRSGDQPAFTQITPAEDDDDKGEGGAG